MQLSMLLDRVHDEFPAVPEVLALRALSDATKEFCTRTHAWQGMVADLILVVGTAQYYLVPPGNTQVVAAIDVRLDGTKLTPSDPALSRGAHSRPTPGKARSFTQWSPALIELDRPAAFAGTITAKAALTLQLGDTATEVPDAILDEYGEAIAAGAKMRLVRQAGQPWTNPDAAAVYGAIFYSAVSTAKTRVMSALGEAPLQVQMRGW